MHAALARFNSTAIVFVPISDCAATDYNEAISLSIQHAMRLIDEGWAFSSKAISPDS